MTKIDRPPPPLALPRPPTSPRGLVVSIASHVGIILLVLWLGRSGLLARDPVPTAGEFLLAPGGGGGGGGARAVAVTAPVAPRPRQTSPAKIPEPVVQPEVVPPPVVVEPEPIEQPLLAVPVPTAPAPSAGTTGTGTGGGAGSGEGSGTGSGVGPGSGSGSGGGGSGGGARPPEPRQMILPPLDFPKVMRGRTVAVTFWVGLDGKVDRLEIEPEIPDKGFRKKFEEVMRNYRFRPARSALGEVVPGTTTVSVTF